MTPLTNAEIGYMQSEFTRIQQDFKLRELYGEVIINSIVSKVDASLPNFTNQENRLIQWHLQWKLEGLTRLTDQRLQHILMTQNHQGFGAPGNPGPTNLPPSVGGAVGTNFFDPSVQYKLCLSIISKLSGS